MDVQAAALRSLQTSGDTDQNEKRTIEDPLVAALPPNTDYITYLTLLDYNLTPQNLPTLNRLLGEDDGTLAAEIGWDLLKLVLPMLRVEPIAGQQCLDLVARRGNPREVIVRVSEEFERLGNHDMDDQAELADEDGLPTFAGEAPRVHLGDMKLAGMPDGKSSNASETKITEDEDGDEDEDEHVPGMANDEVVFVALTSMLSLLHPRIKTKHPSRFLATSLPAALGAYRRLSMNTVTTNAILNTLNNLGGRQRPALPPRVSTSDILRMSAPLPDPEGSKETDRHTQESADTEAAVAQKLLQAVLLEVFDERTTASSQGQPPITARLRLLHEPSTLLSTRRLELESLASNPYVQEHNNLQLKFYNLARSLKLDLASEIAKIGSTPEYQAEDEELGEYPTSPNHIPLSECALVLLYTVPYYTDGSAASGSVNASELLKALTHVWRDDETAHKSRVRNSAPAVDCILALLYTIFCTDLENKAASVPEPLLINAMKFLQGLFMSCPDPDLRDNAHHISTHIFHGFLSRTARLQIIREFTELSTSQDSPFVDGIAGSVRAIAVDWLRDELFPTQAVRQMCSHQTEIERYLPMSCLGDLSGQLFRTTLVDRDPPDDLEDTSVDGFVANLPYFISVLNLLTLVGSHLTKDMPELDIALAAGEVLLRRVTVWKDWCLSLLIPPREDTLEVGRLALPDIFALEDAVARAHAATSLEE